MQKIILSIVLLWLGSLACMQSAPAPNSPPPTKAARAMRSGSAITALTCEVNTHALNVRDCAGIDCSIIGWLEAGWIVKAEPGTPGKAWIKITRDNLTGFARADYLNCK